MYINKNKVLLHCVNSLCHKVAHFLWFKEAIWSKHWEEYVLLGLALKYKNASTAHLGNYLLSTEESYSLSAQHIHKT